MHICFIIVSPAVPENVGAIARAINTMGFSELRLVNPCNHLDEKALWLAHGSQHILQEAKVYSGLQEALCGIEYAVATTAKKRKVKEDYIPLPVLKAFLDEKNIANIAIVFGSEESGLKNNEMALCNAVSSVPLNKPYPSLNLAQAVMLYAYELSRLHVDNAPRETALPEAGKLNALLQNIETINKASGLSENKNLSNRIIERVNQLSSGDAALVLSATNKIIEKLL